MNAFADIPTQKCGACKRVKPRTPEHFDQNSRTGLLMKSCRACADRYWRRASMQPRQRPTGPQKIRQVDIDQLRRDADSHTAKQLAVLYHTKPATMRRWLKVHGITAKPAPRGRAKGYTLPHNRTTPRRLSWLVQGGLW